jgi:hypothetical protein
MENGSVRSQDGDKLTQLCTVPFLLADVATTFFADTCSFAHANFNSELLVVSSSSPDFRLLEFYCTFSGLLF